MRHAKNDTLHTLLKEILVNFHGNLRGQPPLLRFLKRPTTPRDHSLRGFTEAQPRALHCGTEFAQMFI